MLLLLLLLLLPRSAVSVSLRSLGTLANCKVEEEKHPLENVDGLVGQDFSQGIATEELELVEVGRLREKYTFPPLPLSCRLAGPQATMALTRVKENLHRKRAQLEGKSSTK